MRRRALALVLTAALALGATPAIAYATGETPGDVVAGEEQASGVATYDGKSYETLAAAVQAVIDSSTKSGTVVLSKDSSGSGIGLFVSKDATGVDLTIDFGGHTYTCEDPAVGSTGTETQGFHLEKGNTVTLKNGTIAVAEESFNTKMLIQNYCDLTLEDLTLTGGKVTQYIVSSNYGDVVMDNVNISGSYDNGNPVAIDLMHWLNAAYHDAAPTMQISNYESNSISGAIDVYCYGSYDGVEASNCTDKPELVICGGKYSTDVSEYVPSGYKCAESPEGTWIVQAYQSGEMELETKTDSSGNVAGTLDGIYGGENTTISGSEAEGSSTGVNKGDVVVDLTSSSEGDASPADATLTVPAKTAQSLKSASSLTVEADAAKVTFDGAALSKIGGVQDSDVLISIEKNEDETVAASYTVSATANGADLLPYGDESNGTVTVSIPIFQSYDNLEVWYVVPNNGKNVFVEKLVCVATDEAYQVTISHLSTIVFAKSDAVANNTAVAKVTDTNGDVKYVSSFDDAISSVATKGGTIELLDDASMTRAAAISGNVVIKGNKKKITGVANDASVNFTVSDLGSLDISDVTLDGFGSEAATNSGIAVIKVDSGKSGTKVTANNVTVSNFCRSAFDIRSGEFTISDSTIYCGTAGESSENTKLTKGILVGLGTGKVTGSIVGTVITDSSSNYDKWSSGGIEIYQNAEVTISNCDITNVNNGISVDNYYAAGGDGPVGATVTVSDCRVTASGNAIRLYGSGNDSSIDEVATVNVNSGNYIGAVAVLNGSSSSPELENIAIVNAYVDGEIKNNDGSITFVGSLVETDQDDLESLTDVTFVNTQVNDMMQNSESVSSEALLNGKTYPTLSDAVAAAQDGDTIYLLKDVVLDGNRKGNNEGILTITNDISLEGNGKTITAKNVTVEGTANGPSMINIQNGAKVAVNNLIIDGKGAEGSGNTKHGLNVYGRDTEVTVTNVTAKNGNGYGVVVNGASATINGLTTSGNGWGGVNVDSKSAPASLTINGAELGEENSVKIENSSPEHDNPKVEINGGIFKYVTAGTEIDDPDLTISGGTFKTGSLEGAVNPGEHVADGFEWDPATGKVQKETTPSVPSTPSKPTYDVTVPESDGGAVKVTPSNPREGDEATITATPDEGKEVREVVVTDAEGKAIEVTPNEDGTWTFEMPKGDVTVEVTFGCDGGGLCPTHGYADLDQGEWYHDAVDWAVTSGAILGYGDGTFGPGRPLTRAEMATILCRLAGEPEADLSSLPADVPASEWYANGVAWALSEGVFNGNGDGSFDPAGAITREQAACVLYNRAAAAGEDVSARADLSGFADAGELSGWAEEAMSWAVAEGVFSGGASGLEPGRALTRSEGAAILWNWETRE